MQNQKGLKTSIQLYEIMKQVIAPGGRNCRPDYPLARAEAMKKRLYEYKGSCLYSLTSLSLLFTAGETQLLPSFINMQLVM